MAGRVGHHERNGARGGRSAKSSDDRLHARFFWIPNLSRRVDAFHRPVRHGFFGHRVQHEHVQIGLEQVLDRLERGEIKAEHALPGQKLSPFIRIADEIRKTFETN